MVCLKWRSLNLFSHISHLNSLGPMYKTLIHYLLFSYKTHIFTFLPSIQLGWWVAKKQDQFLDFWKWINIKHVLLFQHIFFKWFHKNIMFSSIERVLYHQNSIAPKPPGPLDGLGQLQFHCPGTSFFKKDACHLYTEVCQYARH